MTSSNQTNNAPFQRSQSADFAYPQPRYGLLMAHSSGTLPAMSSPISFQRRTIEGARHFRESALRQIEPLVETARTVRQNALTIGELISRSSQSEANVNSTNDNHSLVQQPSLNYISINLEGASTNDQSINQQNNPSNNNQEDQHHDVFANNAGQHNIDLPENPTDQINVNPIEAQLAFEVLLKYVPFVLILLAKAVYDFHEGIFILVILFGTFTHANTTVKHEALKRARRSIWTLSVELCYIFVCIVSIHYLFEDDLHNFNMILNLVLIRTFNHPLTVLNLLWIVTITDFTLKLITVMIKIMLTMLPGRIIEFIKRGKIYLFIEAISQLYRSIATIQPWLYYLLESYQGPEKIVAVFLSAFYMISKGSDLMFKVKLLKTTFFKLLQSVSLGTSPSKEQIQTAGDHCPICHDNYSSPVLLQCRHIFCESCVSTWFDREQTCPLCRARIVDDPSWRDGSTSYFIQLF
ncbi:E3 ubiquitin-protein ligase RNFT2-like isoform X2 [Rhynchophorus ferrugineus]|uniref:E3 ubiquitin-protein ligase RNFT2-like isoform X2 n=1 Tax=Rhynchophorus ferrugineus TaxID=354439 RepID=UPI003FCD772F